MKPQKPVSFSCFTILHNSGLSHSAINTARSALSSYLSTMWKTDISDNILLRRSIKGIFQLRPSFPKYNYTWNENHELKFLKTIKTTDVRLRLLSMKLATLLPLATGQRCQIITSIDIDCLELTENSLKKQITQNFKDK